MRTAAALALLGALGPFARWDWNEFDARARKARTPEAVAELEKDAFAPVDDRRWSVDRGMTIGSIVHAWQRVGRPADAVRVVERLRTEVAPRESSAYIDVDAVSAEADYADALAYAGRLDDALAAANRVIERASSPHFLNGVDDGPNWVMVGVEMMARIHERRGAYAEALSFYERWRGTSYRFRDVQLAQRGTCIARCRWKLGQNEAALDLAFDTALSKFQAAPFDDPFTTACEIAVRTGQLDRLRRRIDGVVDAEKRLRFERAFAVVTALAKKDAKALLDALGPSPARPDMARILMPGESEFVVKCLREIGPAGVGELLARIRCGDERVLELLGWAYVPEALPALRERRGVAGITKSEMRNLDNAIESIESAVPPR